MRRLVSFLVLMILVIKPIVDNDPKNFIATLAGNKVSKNIILQGLCDQLPVCRLRHYLGFQIKNLKVK